MTARVLHVVLVLLLVLSAGCSVLQGEVFEDRSPAPDFLLPNVDGGKVSLRELRGKVVVVYMTNL